jgi:hypothetical protein
VLSAPLRRSPGPLERTSAELERIRRLAAFRRAREQRWRRRLRESDLLLDLIEQCRLRGYVIVPTQVWAAVVRFVGSVDPQLRDDLGINRMPDHISDVLFAAQEQLLRVGVHERQPRLAPIIPLFGDGAAPPEEAASDRAEASPAASPLTG